MQYKYTAKFAYENTYGIQAISEEEYKNVTENYLPTCELKIKDCNDAEDFSGERLAERRNVKTPTRSSLSPSHVNHSHFV